MPPAMTLQGSAQRQVARTDHSRNTNNSAIDPTIVSISSSRIDKRDTSPSSTPASDPDLETIIEAAIEASEAKKTSSPSPSSTGTNKVSNTGNASNSGFQGNGNSGNTINNTQGDTNTETVNGNQQVNNAGGNSQTNNETTNNNANSVANVTGGQNNVANANAVAGGGDTGEKIQDLGKTTSQGANKAGDTQINNGNGNTQTNNEGPEESSSGGGNTQVNNGNGNSQTNNDNAQAGVSSAGTLGNNLETRDSSVSQVVLQTEPSSTSSSAPSQVSSQMQSAVPTLSTSILTSSQTEALVSSSVPTSPVQTISPLTTGFPVSPSPQMVRTGSSSSSLGAATIALIVLGALCLFSIIGALGWFIRHRQQLNKAPQLGDSISRRSMSVWIKHAEGSESPRSPSSPVARELHAVDEAGQMPGESPLELYSELPAHGNAAKC